jgi:hypothetical protein
MSSDLDSESLAPDAGPIAGRPQWVKVGAVALASALAGGLAAAWWYKKTLSRLQEAEEAEDTNFRILDE